MMIKKVKLFLFITYCACASLVCYSWLSRRNTSHVGSRMEFFYDTKNFEQIVYAFLEKRQGWKTSKLGQILFQTAPPDLNFTPQRNNKTFVILIWSYYNWLKERHIVGFDGLRKDPLDDCSVKNCIISGKDTDISRADAVVVHVQKGVIPRTDARKPEQRWIFLSDETPLHAFSLSRRRLDINELANVFNWSMSYRSISDVPVPYGRTVPFTHPLIDHLTPAALEELIPNWKQKRNDILITIMMSNCIGRRVAFVNELAKYIKVDGFGSCFEGKDKTADRRCPGHFKSDCPAMSEYIFYLVLENSFCDEYLTEKSFYNAYSKGAIPIILGPTTEDCKALLPPNSYLHIEDFPTPAHLANRIIDINEDRKKLLDFHVWRNYFEVKNEHGYFGSKSQHYCRVCEALNYNDRSEKVYGAEDLRPYFDPKYACR